MKEYRYVYENGKLPDTFKMIPFITNLDEKYLKDILASSRVREYECDETIVEEGKVEEWMYILLTGRAEVMKRDETLAVLERTGDIFGELALIHEEGRSASVLATRKTVCLVVDKASLDRMKEDSKNACYAAIFRLFVDIIAKRLKSTSKDLARVQAELDELKAQTAGRRT